MLTVLFSKRYVLKYTFISIKDTQARILTARICSNDTALLAECSKGRKFIHAIEGLVNSKVHIYANFAPSNCITYFSLVNLHARKLHFSLLNVNQCFKVQNNLDCFYHLVVPKKGFPARKVN